MKSAHNRRIVMGLAVCLAVFYGLARAPRHGQATDDEGTRIYQLARGLHRENTNRGSFTVWVNGDIGEDSTARRTSVKGGDPLPAFKLSLFSGSSTLQSQDLKGPYILNFWSSWCSVCRAEFVLFDKKIKDKSLQVPVIFVDTLDSQVNGERYVASLGAANTLTIAFDSNSQLFSSLWFTANPDTVLVDADGHIQAIQIGAVSDLSLTFFNEIAQHPGVGSFDRLHPDVQPTQSPATPTAPPVPTSTLD
jgi:thiol-disulfide isomerase/thioredoxin